MIIKFIHKLGGKGIDYYIRTIDFISFVFRCLFYMFHPRSYGKIGMNTLVNQLYLSSVNLLPLFILSALFLGSALIIIALVFAINYNLQEQIGTLLVSFVMNEFAPLFTTFFIILSYGLTLYSKVTAVKNRTEDMFSDIYAPKLISSLISVSSMSLLFATIMLASGYIVLSFYLNMDLSTYKRLIINAIMLENIFILLSKGMIFGFISVIIPIYYAHKVKQGMGDTTEYMIKILGSLLISVFFTEVLLLLVFY